MKNNWWYHFNVKIRIPITILIWICSLIGFILLSWQKVESFLHFGIILIFYILVIVFQIFRWHFLYCKKKIGVLLMLAGLILDYFFILFQEENIILQILYSIAGIFELLCFYQYIYKEID